MRTIKLILIFIFLKGFFVFAQDKDTLVDERDGKIYKTIRIGGQIWMAENLNYETEKSWCYQNKKENCDIFGRLYTWGAAMNACPTGWHLPTDEEWQQLEKFLGMPEADLKKVRTWRGTGQGEKLLSDTTLGFNILLGGFRNPPANNNLLGMQAFFWTATEEAGLAYFRQFYNKSLNIFRRTRPKSWSFSVRCVKN